MIVIRTHASSTVGIGHLARCRRLAIRLQQQGFEILFVVDCENIQLNNYLSAFPVHMLYSNEADFASEVEDAAHFLSLMGGVSPEAILVDDYRLSAIWEQSVSHLEAPLIVVDDRDSDLHHCQLLIDAKWEGERTAQRYQHKVPDFCTRLLGPAYLLMDASSEAKERAVIETEQSVSLNLLLSLGGGGDLALLVELMRQLIEQMPKGVHCTVRPVVGPYAIHQQELLAFSQQYAVVQPITNQDGLLGELSHTDLYVGAAGGTLFEALALRIPSLTFSISDNQHNGLADLEALGHYFHLNSLQPNAYADLAKLICVMLTRLDRLRLLYHQPATVQIDGKGVERVAHAIERLISGEQILSLEDEQRKEEKTPGDGYQLSPVDDRQVNRYLDARNLDLNLKNMTVKEKVGSLYHYTWWLQSNRRSSYLLERSGEPLLYIWHQLQQVNGIEVLVGGWFVCSERCTPIDAMYALNQQLKMTDETFAELPWVAVIHQQNRFVQQLNGRLGFKRVEAEDVMAPVVQSCFPMATHENFFYYVREPQIASE
ncbi:MAG: UDP-2,4-diacetamido-2,4,6-trideoxy-beta-L-altropyranose hydrolase [Gammaproteobacteria bacterium]|nr:UDP-2,4-diacetamido-2,4,6-trideoxy-beta-L-altropyranose hydrolase [Candidatus Neomarinimicrobiota bacterium]MBT4330922.1 UDP-2,4-diacetamido-2,4,6-trideoxy-beta-L-altropyranose hydrolase [Gammaproteobacteria bacterium]MBT5745168.1 UDP-2,4-diacetamido-2,4,6-trideoxy-beta-L-altropyranose hydrolase [Gammaproteobacteria bacterium]MBT6669050.1 UDP-2,4-diacetamido-2,4,6-trideoxy-beta-L-altropyranose hydrolase [Gammaproteobacteria bacterium]